MSPCLPDRERVQPTAGLRSVALCFGGSLASRKRLMTFQIENPWSAVRYAAAALEVDRNLQYKEGSGAISIRSIALMAVCCQLRGLAE